MTTGEEDYIRKFADIQTDRELNRSVGRGQSHDNEATMAGNRSGVQKRFFDLNPLAACV